MLKSELNKEIQKEEYYKKYNERCVVYDNPPESVEQVALKRVSQCRIMNDRYARENNKDRSIPMVFQSIKSLEKLQELTYENSSLIN